VPGGFEEFFFNFDGSIINNSTSDGLARWDVYPEPGFIPRRDVRDGKAGPGNWYDGPNELPEGMAEPVWVAKNHGPKWLNSEGGRYQIVAPFVTGRQTGGMFSQGTVTVSPFVADGHGEVGVREGSGVRSEVATAFVVEEGQLEVRVEGYEPVSLIDGDVVFVPGNTSFWYEAAAEFTKFMYVTGGGKGLDYDLMAHAQPWDSTFYPQLEGSRMNRGMMSRI
jgi:mannose-6-phosphate isomerase-like protein (cupin superfamily)